MATERADGGKKPANPKIMLRGIEPDQESGPIEVSAIDRQGKCLAAVPVADDGTFNLTEAILEKSHRVRIGPGGDAAKEAADSVFLSYRVADFRAILDTGIIDIAPGVWQPWFPFFCCVSGSVQRCRRAPWWYLDLAVAAQKPIVSRKPLAAITQQGLLDRDLSITNRITPTLDLDDLVLWPFRCAKVCLGTVEVYRRVCCCDPWILFDSRLDGLIEGLEEIVNGIPEIPPGPLPPGPDPLPIQKAFFRDGALDEGALRAAQDLEALRALPAENIADYVNAHRYLICGRYSCGEPVKVAEGSIGPDGRFNICWQSFPFSLRAGCHEEFAYKVKQKQGIFTFTIYDGVTAGQWYGKDDEPVLQSYHPLAIACRDNGEEGDAFVYLDVIGDTGSEHLGTPLQDSATSVDTPVANSGVAFPAGGEPGATGVDRNWGGTLKLSILFSESMRTIGAKFYRVSIMEANEFGNSVGSREYFKQGLSWTKAVAVPGGVDVVPVVLGPKSEGGEDHLYEIPFDGGLGNSEDWEADQYHVHLDTLDSRWNDPSIRHLLTVEVFDATGQRLRPNGTPASGLDGTETTAAFTFRRKFQATGSTDMVSFGALTHMFWWDNREVVATIEDLRMDGIESDEECQFLTGTASSTFGIGYRAYHPEELFQRDHTIWWKRGLSGGTGVLLPAMPGNVGVPPALPEVSPIDSFGNMLGISSDPSRTKCAFTVFLQTVNKITDGDYLGYRHMHDSAAFALDIAPTICPPCECDGGENGNNGGG